MARKYTAAEKRAREQYSRFSRRVRSQLRTLERRDPSNLNLSKYRTDTIPTLREMDEFFGGRTPLSKLKQYTSKISGLYRSQVFTVRGYNKSMLSSLNYLRSAEGGGFTWLNETNIKDMWNFIEDMRARGLADIFGYRHFIGIYNRIRQDQSITQETVMASVEMWTRKAEEFRKRKEKDPYAEPSKLYFRRKKKSSNLDF